MRAEGLSTTTPSAPSTISMSPSRTSSRTLPSATTAGTPMLRATIAVCEVRTAQVGHEGGEAPAAQPSMSAGEISCATTTSGSSPSSLGAIGQHGRGAGQHVQRPFDDLAHVAAALLAQVFVFHGFELLAQDLP